jgi:hypothetical protein
MALTLTDDIFISLLKAYENVQHFELSAPNEYRSSWLPGQQRN